MNRGHEISVLHVDDDQNFADLTAEFLEREDERISVQTANSADEGLEQLAESEIDCIVSDYQMPGMNGIDFLETSRDNNPDLPFILYTGKGSEEVASEAISAGVTDYLQKESGTSQYTVLANRVTNAVEQYRSRQHLEETEQKLSEIADKTNDVLFIFSGDWSELLFINSAYEDVWGGSIAELKANPESFLDLVHPDDRETARKSMERLSNGEPDVIEYRVQSSEDDWGRWIRGETKPIFDDDGNVDRIVGFAKDITEQKHRESRLQQTAAHLEALFENSPDMIDVLDTEGTILEANRRFCEELDYDEDELLGTPIWEHDQLVDGDYVTTLLSDFEQGERRKFEGQYKRRDGSTVPVEVHLLRLNLDGEDRFVAVSRDITERKERERELKAARGASQKLIEASPVPIWVQDVEEILYSNDAAAAFFGHDDTESLVGNSSLSFVPENEQDLARQRNEEMLETGEAMDELSGKVVTKDGTVHEAVFAAAPITYYGEQAIVTIANDITERKAYEQKLTALHDVADDLTTGTSVEEVCERTIDAAEAVLDFDLSIVAIEDDEFLQIKAASGEMLPDKYEGMHVSEGLAGKTYRTAEAFIVDEASSHEVADPQGNFESVLSLPVGEHGNFQAVAEERNAFDEEDLELAELLVSHTETVLDRLQREATLTALHDAATRLESATSETDVYEIAVATAEDILEFDFVNVDVVVDDRLELQASSAGKSDGYQSVPLDADDNLGVRAYQQGETIVENDLRNAAVTPADSDLGSALTVPIGRFGTFQAGSRSANAFDETDRELAELLVTHTETALKGLQQEAALTALHDAATRLESAAAETDVYDIVIETAEDILEFDLVAVDIEEDGALIQRAWSLGRDADGYYEETPLDEDTFATRAFKRQETLLIDDLREYDITPADAEYRSALTVPIADVGTFQTVSREVGAFDETDRELAELLVDHAREALQRLEQERSLREQRDRLRRENERLDQFASIVSHDLRNPLTVANGELELARTERDSEHLDEVATSLERMETIIKDVLAMARGGQAVEESELDPIDLADVARECWVTVQTADADLEVTTDATVRADRDRLKRVLENLIRNAIEHGGRDVTITIGRWDDGFYVADNGTGIPLDDRDSIFDFGYTTTDGGTGFGLAIVKEIVAAHGWSIDVVESDGGGARFEISGVSTTSTAE
jgi:PAS domain S-box-containing protein